MATDCFQAIAETWNTSLIIYAIARDAACWQLNQPEPQVCDLLDSLEACHPTLRFNQSPVILSLKSLQICQK